MKVPKWTYRSTLKSYYTNLACSHLSIISEDVLFILSPQPSNASNLFKLSADDAISLRKQKQNQSGTNLKNFGKFPPPFSVSGHSSTLPVTVDDLFSQVKANICILMSNVTSSSYSSTHYLPFAIPNTYFFFFDLLIDNSLKLLLYILSQT